MQETIEKLREIVMLYGMRILAAILIIIIGKWVARLLAKIAENVLMKTKLNKTLAVFCKNIVYYGIQIFVFVAALNKLGVETTSFVALIGAAGLAVGLALQGSLSNFAAGVMIVVFQPFEVGDIVEAGGAAGQVEEIQIFNTIFSTPDNKRIIVPNAKITADKITVFPDNKK